MIEGNGVAACVLKNLDIDTAKIETIVEWIAPRRTDHVTFDHLPDSDSIKDTLTFSIEECRNLDHKYVGTEHLLLGLLREKTGHAARVFDELAVEIDEVRREVLNVLGRG